ncbi:MAG: bifunctional glycosyltransferase family 2/GtrA family protein [Chloroflexota bacterium]|nr:bifunctional glycosyltransferase family 2/GtrA family protein [Chloroflexota bacterium]
MPVTREKHTPLVDIVVPVYNEDRDVEGSVRRLRDYLDTRFPFPARITVADNASTDRTWPTASRLEREVPGVRALRLERKGRGLALRAAWLASDAPIVGYTDVDLSTDLNALLPLVAPLVSGHSAVAIGSRLTPGARVVRGPKREFISRSYNLLLRAVLGVRFRDAQCGFKAIRADVARDLLPHVEDQGWFFDTELLVLAERAGLRIHEVPVDWVDDPDSRVDVLRTTAGDLRGVWRLVIHRDAPRLPRVTQHASRSLSLQLATFAMIGAASTVAYALLFAALRTVSAAVVANAAALIATAIGNTAANRRLTFGVRGRRALWRDHLAGVAALGVALVITTTAAGLLQTAVATPGRRVELGVLLAANAFATVVRFGLLRSWTGGERPPTSTIKQLEGRPS